MRRRGACVGAADLYAWATTGQEVLAAYGEAESVLRLVENTFTSALGKLLVGAAAGGVGLWGLRGSGPRTKSEERGGFPAAFFASRVDKPAAIVYNPICCKENRFTELRKGAAQRRVSHMAKDLRISFLLDFYGDMLTDTQREVVDAYYNEDLSLAEIAQDRDITRQGVRDAIKRAEQQLLEMEERLGLAGASRRSKKP